MQANFGLLLDFVFSSIHHEITGSAKYIHAARISYPHPEHYAREYMDNPDA